jgi:hypothetical protein
MAFMEKYGVDSDEIWEVHGSTWVVKHKALERVAAEKGIRFAPPTIIECDSINGVVSLCVEGKLADHTEWSIGEAAPKNNKNSYPYAMAEKRAKDRVILKLLAAHGELYSEAEADEFRQNPHVTRPADVMPEVEYDQHGQPIDNIPHPDPGSVKKLRVADQRPIFKALQDEIHAITSSAELRKWAETNANRLGELKTDWQEMLRGVYAEHLAELRKQERGDDLRMAG